MKPIKSTVITTVETRRFELTGDDLRALLERADVEKIPLEAQIYICVPGGGDWSNMSLDVSKETPVVIEWKIETVKNR